MIEEEKVDGVNIKRLPVAFRLSKGVLMPGLIPVGCKLIGWAEVVNLHLPQMDAGPLSVIARCLKKPVIVTYHCDLDMPTGAINWLAEKATGLMHHIAVHNASAIVHNTQDYAENSKFLRKYLDKLKVIPTPIDQIQAYADEINVFKDTYKIGKKRK